MKYGRLKFRIPGTSWCGNNWSDNRRQSNNCGYATARSRFDQACKEHDCDIHRGVPYKTADWKFAKSAFRHIGLSSMAPYIAHSLAGEQNKMPPTRKNNYQDYFTPPNSSMSRTRSMSISSQGSRMSFGSKYGSGFAATSGYAGKLNRNGSASAQSSFITNEYGNYDGQSGTAPNTSNCYLLAHSFPIWNVVTQVLASVILKQFRNSGTDLTKTTDLHSMIGPNPWLYKLTFFHDTYSDIQIPINSANSVLYAASVLVDNIRQLQALSGDKPPRFWLQELVLIKDTADTFMQINLKNTYIHTRTNLNIRIQNQTTSESGGGETTDIDSNPLEGRIYDINSSYMIGRGRDAQLNGEFPSRLPNTKFQSSITGLTDYAFPKTQEILNCKKVSSIHMPPGSIKRTNVKGEFKGFLNNLVCQALPDQTTVVPFNFKPPLHKNGYGILVVFRKLMRDDTAGITIAWDTQFRISTKVSKKYPAFGVAQSSFAGTPIV